MTMMNILYQRNVRLLEVQNKKCNISNVSQRNSFLKLKMKTKIAKFHMSTHQAKLRIQKFKKCSFSPI